MDDRLLVKAWRMIGLNRQKLIAWPRKYLWNAPRGLFYKLTRDSDAMMRAFINGKSVALVGNAQSLLGAGLGTRIDQHDVVIRMNKGFVTDPASQGTRTDIVTLTPELTEADVVEKFKPKLFLFLIHRLRHFNIKTPENLKRTAFYAHRYWFADRTKIGRRPSSGYMMISYLLRLNCAKDITLYGFDFGKTPTFYNPVGYQTPHDFHAEGRIIREYVKSGKINLSSPFTGQHG
jgi:hypothetical protein